MFTPIDALGDELKRRMENPFWGSFIISWLLINWKVVYITFSWSSQKIDDKIQYIEDLYKFSNFLEALLSIVHLFIFPLIASAVAIWWIPILAREYLKKQIQNKEKDDKLKIKEIKSEKLVIQEKIDLQKEEQELQKSGEQEWNKEYNEILKTGIIPTIVRFIFEENGQNYYKNNGVSYLDTYTLATAVKYELIVQSGEREYTLTDKGKYILKKYPTEDLKKSLGIF